MIIFYCLNLRIIQINNNSKMSNLFRNNKINYSRSKIKIINRKFLLNQ